jgi:hypothetical protein
MTGDDKKCYVHEEVMKAWQDHREEARGNFEEIFHRLRIIETRLAWVGGAIAAIMFLTQLIPVIERLLRGKP